VSVGDALRRQRNERRPWVAHSHAQATGLFKAVSVAGGALTLMNLLA
jgi:hypothetical protein